MPTRCPQCLAPTTSETQEACAFCGTTLSDEDAVELFYEDDRVRVSTEYVTNVRDGRVIAIARVRTAKLRRPGNAVPGFLGFVAAFVAWAALWRFAPESPWLRIAPIGLVVVGILGSVFLRSRTADLVVTTDLGEFVVGQRLAGAKANEAQAAVRRALERMAA